MQYFSFRAVFFYRNLPFTKQYTTAPILLCGKSILVIAMLCSEMVRQESLDKLKEA